MHLHIIGMGSSSLQQLLIYFYSMIPSWAFMLVELYKNKENGFHKIVLLIKGKTFYVLEAKLIYLLDPNENIFSINFTMLVFVCSKTWRDKQKVENGIIDILQFCLPSRSLLYFKNRNWCSKAVLLYMYCFICYFVSHISSLWLIFSLYVFVIWTFHICI